MKIPHAVLTKGALWTVVSFGAGQFVRLATNVVLTRLLAPDLFGIMLIANTLKTGVELVSDVGIGQSIIYNKKADQPEFYETAWTLKVVRGLLLWLVTCALAIPAAHFYDKESLLAVMPIASFVLVITGFSSISLSLVQKKLKIAQLTTYEVITGVIWAVGQIALAYHFPNIWALVLGVLFGSLVSTAGSFFLPPRLSPKLTFSKSHAYEIMHFGKWIFFSSIIYFLSSSFDRLYLASVIPLTFLGIYGLSRSISELLTSFVIRLGNVVVFPFIASHTHLPPAELRAQLLKTRLVFLLMAAFVFSLSAASLDLVVKLLFDVRYHAAGWIVPILLLGSWISIVCTLNESTLLGLGKPAYGAAGNGLKLIWLVASLPIIINRQGIVVGIIAIAVSDIWRYIPIYIGQIRARFSFGAQDLLATVLVFALVAIFEMLRAKLGYGTSFADLPI